LAVTTIPPHCVVPPHALAKLQNSKNYFSSQCCHWVWRECIGKFRIVKTQKCGILGNNFQNVISWDFCFQMVAIWSKTPPTSVNRRENYMMLALSIQILRKHQRSVKVKVVFILWQKNLIKVYYFWLLEMWKKFKLKRVGICAPVWTHQWGELRWLLKLFFVGPNCHIAFKQFISNFDKFHSNGNYNKQSIFELTN
jgi:hypothetical protein